MKTKFSFSCVFCVLFALLNATAFAEYRRVNLPEGDQGVYSLRQTTLPSAPDGSEAFATSASSISEAETYVAAGVRGVQRETMRSRAEKAMHALNAVLDSTQGRDFLKKHSRITVEPTKVYGATGEILIRLSGPSGTDVQTAASELHKLLKSNPDVAFSGVAGTLEIH